MISTIVSSFIAFVSTNIDDIFVLMALFSQVRVNTYGDGTAASLGVSSMKSPHIVIGQYLGFTAIVVVSIIGALSTLFIPVPWIGLLGLVPIYMGVKGQLALRRSDSENEKEENVSGAGTAFKAAAITFANGGDNIAIYIPLFASQTLSGSIVTLIVFFLMVAVWCFLGYKLVKAPIHVVLESYLV